jgi:transposase
LVDARDLATLGLRQGRAAAPGRPSSQPGALLQLDIDGELYRCRASRRLEQETPRHVALLWRLTKRRPDHNTIANVRRAPLTPLRAVCRTVTLVCKQLERCGGALGALEGRQCRAVNAQGRHGTTAKLAQGIAQMDGRVADELTEVAAADDQDEAGPPGGARAAGLQTKRAALRERRRRAQDLQAAVAGSGQAQRALPAPDSRAMQGGPGRGTAGGDTVQTAGDAQHKLIGAGAGTNDPTDRDWRSPRAVAAPAGRGGPFAAGAAMGSSHGQAVQQGLPADIPPALARPRTAAHQQRGRGSTADCTDEAATDTESCPAGAGLRVRFAPLALGRHMRDDATSACRPCPLQAQCTRHEGGRRSTRGVDEQLLEQRAQRVHARPESMPQRTERVEQPCGPRKRSGQQGYGLMRGVAKGRAECSWSVLADTLRRGLHRVAMPRRLASLGEGEWTGPGGMPERLRMSETSLASRPQDHCNRFA